MNRMRLSLNESNIVWPGRPKNKPHGVEIPKHIKVLTIEEKPFVYVREIEEMDEEQCTSEEIPCPHYNSSKDGRFLYVNIIIDKNIFLKMF